MADINKYKAPPRLFYCFGVGFLAEESTYYYVIFKNTYFYAKTTQR